MKLSFAKDLQNKIGILFGQGLPRGGINKQRGILIDHFDANLLQLWQHVHMRQLERAQQGVDVINAHRLHVVVAQALLHLLDLKRFGYDQQML